MIVCTVIMELTNGIRLERAVTLADLAIRRYGLRDARLRPLGDGGRQQDPPGTLLRDGPGPVAPGHAPAPVRGLAGEGLPCAGRQTPESPRPTLSRSVRSRSNLKTGWELEAGPALPGRLGLRGGRVYNRADLGDLVRGEAALIG